MHFQLFSFLIDDSECFLWLVQFMWNHLKQKSHLIQDPPLHIFSYTACNCSFCHHNCCQILLNWMLNKLPHLPPPQNNDEQKCCSGVFILNFLDIAQLTLLCLLLTLSRSMTAGYVFNNDIRLIKKELYCNSSIHIINLKFLYIMKITLFDFICENTRLYHWSTC